MDSDLAPKRTHAGMIRDVAEAVLRLNHVMAEYGLSSVRSIELGQRHDGDLFRHAPFSEYLRHDMRSAPDPNIAATIVGVALTYTRPRGDEMMAAVDEINRLNDALAKRAALHTVAIMDRNEAHVVGVKAAMEDAEQRCRYVAKNVADRWDEGEARDAFELACELCENSISHLEPEEVVARWLRDSQG